MTASGYWMDTYWPHTDGNDDYWPQTYWQEHGVPSAPSGSGTSRNRAVLKQLLLNHFMVYTVGRIIV